MIQHGDINQKVYNMRLFDFSLQLKKIDKCKAISRKRPNDVGKYSHAE